MPATPRVTRKCLGSRQPGSNAIPPRSILSKAKRGPKRAPSAYNLHIQAMMQLNKTRIPDARGRFAAAVQSWNGFFCIQSAHSGDDAAHIPDARGRFADAVQSWNER